MVLHNLFFLVLTTAAYFSLIPLFEQLVDRRPSAPSDRLRTPSAATPGRPAIPTVSSEPGASPVVSGTGHHLFTGGARAGSRPSCPATCTARCGACWRRTRPRRPATAKRELIPDSEIMGDEIGQIMRSRNDTVEALRKREDELAAALRRIEEQDRLVSLGLLSASVAHELNTPLAVLAGSIEKLIETNPDSHTQERLARMQRVTQRLRRISESLVDFSRVRKTQMEPTALRPLIEEAWTLVAIDEKSSHVEFLNYAERRASRDRQPRPPAAGVRQSPAQRLNAVSDRTPPGRIEVRTPPRAARRPRVDRADCGRQRPRHPRVRAAGYLRRLRDHAPRRARHRTRVDSGRRHHHPARRHHRRQQSPARRRVPGSLFARCIRFPYTASSCSFLQTGPPVHHHSDGALSGRVDQELLAVCADVVSCCVQEERRSLE